jgi:hypothetical protein
MSHYTLEDLIARWKREELSVEQMIGQFALVLASLEQRLRAVERRVPESGVSSQGPGACEDATGSRKVAAGSRKVAKTQRRG